MAKDMTHLNLDIAEMNNDRGPLHVQRLSKSINPEIQQMIDQSFNGRNIVDIIKQHQKDITHSAIYGKAMQKCTFRHRDWRSALQIMEMLIQSDTKPDIIAFTVFINCMARSNMPTLCMKYFGIMINEYGITPNIITFGALLKSFRRQSKYKEAEKLLKIMKKKYKIRPNVFIYTEMLTIYARAHKQKRAQKLFEKYMRGIKKKNESPDLKIFGAYFSVFSQCGDIKGMERALQKYYEHGFHIDSVMVGDIMRGYNAARSYEKSLAFVYEWADNGGHMNQLMLMMKCIALGQMIHHSASKNLSFDEQQNLYLQLRESVFVEGPKYGIKVDAVLAETVLSGAIFLYRRTDPLKIVEELNVLVDHQLIGYKCLHWATNEIAMDLHGFSVWTAQFLIRYVFAVELSEFIKTKDECLRIIVGKGKHRAGKGNNARRLGEFIESELASWNPPIKAHTFGYDPGTIVIRKDQLSEYLSNDMNYCNQMLINGTKNWYDDA